MVAARIGARSSGRRSSSIGLDDVPGSRPGRALPAGLAVVLALGVLVTARVAVGSANTAASGAASAGECQDAVITTSAEADAWIAENTSSNKGSDAILSVAANPSSGDSRALVRFTLPAGVPDGCVVESAVLQLFASDGTDGSRVEVARLASSWSESRVTWSNQPPVAGEPAAAWSRDGYMQWRVSSQVEAMLNGENHGFLVRDVAEEAAEGGGSHGFYSKEKGESPPQLVIRFAAPSSADPGPPDAPVPAGVRCGEVLTQSTRVTNDLADCSGDGLVIGADNIIVDLGGHTVDGVGLGTGVLNDGYASVTVTNGIVQEFDHGVELRSESAGNVVENLTVRSNELAGIELFDVEAAEVRANTLERNGEGIALVSGTRESVVVANTMTLNSGAGLLVADSSGNRLERNSVSGGGDLGIGLERAHGNTLLDNTVGGNSDGGIEIRNGSDANRVEGNVISESGDTGIMVDESDRNELVANTTRLMSDSGITLNGADDGIVRGNDVRFSPGGLELDGSSRNLVDSNNASNASGNGIELGGGSYGNAIVENVANGNAATGIYVADEAVTEPGNVLDRNTASGNRADGIVLAKGGHTLSANVARANSGWGINATGANVDGLGNVAAGNGQAQQCSGVVCKPEWTPPETTILAGPPGQTEATSASFEFGGDDDTTPSSALRFECRLDGAREVDFVPCSSPKLVAGLNLGPHTFEVRAVDRAANVDPTPATYAWTVVVSALETTIDSGPDAITAGSIAVFTFSAGAPGATFECSLDGSPFSPCSSPAEYRAIADGGHRFRVRARDEAGNIEPEPAVFEWTVDTTMPETTIESGPADPTNETSASVRFGAGEEGIVFACSLDGGVFVDCASPVVYTDLGAGPHSVRVVARDRAGNVEREPAGYGWTIDLTAPDTSIGERPRDPSNQGSAGLAFAGSDDLTEPAALRFECRLDPDGSAWSGCVSAKTYSELAEGRHSFEVRAIDEAGNVDASPAGYSWSIDVTAPRTTITAVPPDPSNDDAASFEFASNEDGSSFDCRLDDGPWAQCSSPAHQGPLAQGAHTFEVRATDRAGNVDALPPIHRWTVDTAPPDTAIVSAPPSSTPSGGAGFAFTAGEESTFECRLDDAEWAPCSSPHAYGGLAPGDHTFEVRAVDAAGNVDPDPAIHRWTVEEPSAPAPETAITSAAPLLSSSTSASFAFASSTTDATFECELDAGGWATCSSPQIYDGLTDGPHTFRVRAIAPAGAVDESPAAHDWTVDTVAPETTIATAPPSPSPASDATFVLAAGEPDASFECRLDLGPWAPCSSPQRYGALLDGPHTFRARATDSAGNTDASPAAHTWIVDTAPPQTTITVAPPALSSSPGASFAFVADEPDASFDCSLDDADFERCVSPRAYTGVPDGRHAFRVRAVDEAGNVGSAVVHTWTVDTVAPETSIDSGPPAVTTSTTATFAISASEAGATLECSLDGGAFAPCASPREYTGLAPGGHELSVRARDAAGNVDGSPAGYRWTIQAPAGCAGPSTASVAANADSWVLESSPTSNYGNDSVLKVDTKAGANARALVRFPLPAIPPGCKVAAATLRLYATSSKQGRTLVALPLGGGWSESSVTWSNRPPTRAAAAAAMSPSTAGYMQWNVTPLVESMYSTANHGFLILDGSEDGNGVEQAFHSREKAPDNPPQLVLRFD